MRVNYDKWLVHIKRLNMKIEKNTENQNTMHRSTFAILFYINRTMILALLCRTHYKPIMSRIKMKRL